MTEQLENTVSPLMHSAALTASVTARTITGLVVPYGEPGATSAGLVSIRAGAVRLPADLSRVKLLNFHSNEVGGVAESIGYAINAQDTPDGLVMTFKIGNTPQGDLALQAAAERVKDGLSVELRNVKVHGDEVVGADLTAVAHVPMPAYDRSRISSIAAQATYNHEHDDPNQENSMTTTAPEQTPEETPAEETPAEETPAEQTPEEQPAEAGELTAGAHMPATMTGTAPRRRRKQLELADVFASISELNRFGSSPELTAALADIGYSSSPWAQQPDYVGELWSGVDYKRKFVPLLVGRKLTSLKAKGWRWVTPPEMADYAGDKAAIPSNAVELEEVLATAQRLAGGHDIDRAYWDFGDTEFVESYYRKQAESYAKKSDARAGAFIAASASGATAAADFLSAIVTAVDEVEDETDGDASYVIVNKTDFRTELLGITNNDVPAFLKELLNIEPGQFVRAPSTIVPQGTVIAGVKQAGAFYELGETPIRVQAVNVANGGNDLGVFGYTASILEHETGIRKVTFA